MRATLKDKKVSLVKKSALPTNTLKAPAIFTNKEISKPHHIDRYVMTQGF